MNKMNVLGFGGSFEYHLVYSKEIKLKCKLVINTFYVF